MVPGMQLQPGSSVSTVSKSMQNSACEAIRVGTGCNQSGLLTDKIVVVGGFDDSRGKRETSLQSDNRHCNNTWMACHCESLDTSGI